MTDLEQMLMQQEGTGIYRIVNTVTGRTYFGSSINMPHRFYDHKRHLNLRTHKNPRLQHGWEKYGNAAFVFESLVTCSSDSLASREQQFIDAYVEHDLPLYNLRPSAFSRRNFVFRHTMESRKRMGELQKGRQKRFTLSVEAREKMRVERTGKPLSLETREKLRVAHLGQRTSMKARLMASLSNKGNKHGLGYRHTAEARSKIGAAAKGNQWNVGKKHSRETLAKMRMSQQARREREAMK